MSSQSVILPEQLYCRIENRVPRSGFESPDDYVAFVLREVLHAVETSDGDDGVDEQQVKDRLESLGYIET
jgi:Arc/MetJ-type ribon-helix-helix transcriptional regulator